MNKLSKNIEINRQSWEDRTAVHLKSKFYDLEAFKKNPMSLKSFELGTINSSSLTSIMMANLLLLAFGQHGANLVSKS